MLLGNVSVFIFRCYHFIKISDFPELSQITGVAAILRFPMPELEDDDEEEDDDNECTPLSQSWNIYFVVYTNYTDF